MHLRRRSAFSLPNFAITLDQTTRIRDIFLQLRNSEPIPIKNIVTHCFFAFLRALVA